MRTPLRKDARLAGLGDAEHGFQKLIGAQRIDGTPLPRQARPTVLVFFASWCGPCRAELAELGDARGAYPDLRIIGVNSYEDFRSYSSQDKLLAFLDRNAPWLGEVVPADPALLRAFGKVPRIPTLLVFDAEGRVVAEFRRDQRPPPSREELDAALARAASTSAQPLPRQ